ncbi:MAG: dihydroorotate dehydrogenase electron transfer subunit, partial [Candidatus Thioglobus sp.]|nr:dihydroorotate dehydrogenase electron transfer subunit [Candidatus Thioglobus sp.]MBT4747331.1 dihydroorotate dehydrogenase electron transfer subunit [Candidatus Thioglobus sp.]MBT5164461.1 dihydroorotate dehydrogenase electron transfer subunit [Candidatus Thioglobus sp.]MBT7839822.1 dihydroorotate dehydrogenase electron transfer subunit [Candidatus Thioglobus sp.]
MSKNNRNTIKVVDCQVLAHYQFEGDQYILTLSSETIANETKPGQFVHITVSDALSMRRPIS